MLFFCEPIFVGLLMCMHHCLLGFRYFSISLPTSLGATGVAEFGALGFSCRDYVEPMFWLFSFLIITV